MSENEIRARDDRAAVDKAIAVLKAFGGDAATDIGVSEIARRADMRKSTAFRLLSMLERNGVVERAGSAYRLGRTLHELGTQVYSPAQDATRDVLLPFLVDLYEQTKHTVHLAVLQGTDVVYLNKLHGHQAVRSPSRIGGRIPAYCTAVGKVLLAADDSALERTLAKPRRKWSPNTLTDATDLQQELDGIRRNGIAFDHGESLSELSCVALPLIGANGRAVAAISVSGDTATFKPAMFEHQFRQIAFYASRAVVARSRELSRVGAA
jgi:IclR family transcriptional regulator, KDG regulon repressor